MPKRLPGDDQRPFMPDRIDAAARWLVQQSLPPHPVVPILRKRFGLTAAEAVAAIRQAGKLRWAA